MSENKRYRILFLITAPKLADKAAELLSNEGVLVENRIHAVGTATSNIMDILGLGSIDKIILFATVPKGLSQEILKKLSKQLHLGMTNTGIAFTVPLTGMNNTMLKMLQDLDETEGRKETNAMSDCKYSIIVANVNRGYSNDVMDAAREAGASGGTVVNSRRIAGEAVCNKWGLGNQEEKELVMIVAEAENKVAIMKSISAKCGIQTEAKGMVFSLPIDEVEGL